MPESNIPLVQKLDEIKDVLMNLLGLQQEERKAMKSAIQNQASMNLIAGKSPEQIAEQMASSQRKFADAFSPMKTRWVDPFYGQPPLRAAHESALQATTPVKSIKISDEDFIRKVQEENPGIFDSRKGDRFNLRDAVNAIRTAYGETNPNLDITSAQKERARKAIQALQEEDRAKAFVEDQGWSTKHKMSPGRVFQAFDRNTGFLGAFENFRTGKTEFGGFVADLAGGMYEKFGKFSTMGKGVRGIAGAGIGGYIAADQLLSAANRFGRMGVGYQNYGAEMGYNRPDSFGQQATDAVFSRNLVTYPQLLMNDIFGFNLPGAGLLGLSEGATEGAQAGYRAWKRGINPFDSLTVQEANDINQGVLQRGYSGPSGLKLEKVITNIVKKTAIDSSSALQLMDLAVRRLRADVQETEEAMLSFGDKSKAAMKSVAEFTKEVTTTAEALNRGGVQGNAAINTAQLLSGRDWISGEGLMQLLQSSPLTAMTQGSLSMQFGTDMNIMTQIATGNLPALGKGDDPTPWIKSSVKNATDLVDLYVRASGDRSEEGMNTAYMLAAQNLGPEWDVQKVRRLYEDKDEILEDADTMQKANAIEKGFEEARGGYIKDQNLRNQWMDFKDATSKNPQKRLHKLYNPYEKVHWDQFFAEDGDRKGKEVMRLLKEGGSSEDSEINEVLNRFRQARGSQESFEELLGESSFKYIDEKAETPDDWKNYISKNKGEVSSVLDKYLKSMKKQLPTLTNESIKMYKEKVLSGEMTFAEARNKLEESVAEKRAREEGRNVVLTLTDEAKRLVRQMDKDPNSIQDQPNKGAAPRNSYTPINNYNP